MPGFSSVHFSQMFWFLLNVRCSSTEPADDNSTVLWLSFGAVISFFFGMFGIFHVTSSGAFEILIFELMLSFAIFIDFSSSRATFFSKYKKFLGFLLLFVVCFSCFSSSAIALSAAKPNLSNSTQALPNNSVYQNKQAAAIILSNAVALAGGAYFIWTLYYDSIEIGRQSIASLKEHSIANAKKISSMKSVSMSQMKLAIRAFNGSALIADCKLGKKIITLEQRDFLKERLCLPPHIFAACEQLSPEQVEAIETTALDEIFGNCCRGCLPLRCLLRTMQRFVYYER